MPSPGNEPNVYKFGEFTVHPRAGELFRRARKIKLQRQPIQVLLALLKKPGQMVSREELRNEIWPADTFVDFEHSLNTAIKKLRLALGDRAKASKYIETLPRRGYRFLRKVEAVEPVLAIRPSEDTLEGKVFALIGEAGTDCLLAPADRKSLEEWRRLAGLHDDVGISMMITQGNLLLLQAEKTVRLLSRDRDTGWCEVRILEGEHYGRTAMLSRKSLRNLPEADAATEGG